MLYKNDEPYKLSAKEIEAVEAFFHGKFPVKVTYPPSRIVPSRLKHNRKPDQPRSISFDLKALVKTPNGTEVWRYAENVTVDEKNIKKYTPKKFLLFGSRWLKRNDIELIYFLLRKSEYRLISEEELKENKNLVQSNTPKFMFEDLVTEAEKRATRKRLQTKIEGLLYGEDFGLPEAKLREVAKAYFIPGIDEYTLAQVQWQLETKINETKTGPDEFFRMVNAEEEIKTRVSITKTMDLGLLVYENTGKVKRWIWKTKEGITEVCKIPVTKSPNEALYEYYQGNEGFREDVQAVLLTNNPNAGKKKEAKLDKDEDE
jgi:hypothetical protein